MMMERLFASRHSAVRVPPDSVNFEITFRL
jgi:hypothetical protein